MTGAEKRHKKQREEEEVRKYHGSMDRFVIGLRTDVSDHGDVAMTDTNFRAEDFESVSDEIQLATQEEVAEVVQVAELQEEQDSIREKIPSHSAAVISELPHPQLAHESVSGVPLVVDKILQLNDPAKWPDSMSDQLRCDIVRMGAIRPIGVTYPRDNKTNRSFRVQFYSRNLSNGETSNREWLIYSVSADSVFCFCCKLFLQSCNERSHLVKDGQRKWHKLSEKLSEHEKSAKHLDCFSQWKELEGRLAKNTAVDGELLQQLRDAKTYWHDVIQRLLAVTQFLASRNIAFRGSNENLGMQNNGNFLGVIELLAKFDGVMGKHVQRARDGRLSDHYLGKDIQNELIDLMATSVKQVIIARIKQARYYSVILDCTRDICHVEQLTCVLRFVSECGDAKEHFLGFIPVTETTGENLTEVLMDTLADFDLSLDDCRGQGYDSGSNMRGKKSGVQSRILEKNPRAFFVPCGCHSWNLVIGDAASSCIRAISLFGTVQRVYTLLSVSPRRWKVLCDTVDITVKPLSETRWECRIESLKALRYQLPLICNVLETVSSDAASVGDSKTHSEAASLCASLQSYDFMVSLVIWYDILFKVNTISKTWQNINIEFDIAMKHVEQFLLWCTEYRDSGMESAECIAKEIAHEMNVAAQFPDAKEKRCKRKRRMFDYEEQDEQVQQPREAFRISFFLTVVDVILQSVRERFEQMKTFQQNFGVLFDIASLRYAQKSDMLQKCKSLASALQFNNECDISCAELCDELSTLSSVVVEKSTAQDVLKFLITRSLTGAYPYTTIALRIFATIPVTVATAERSFSRLKLIKTYLRSTMAQERLNGLAILSIEHDIAAGLDYSDLIRDFSSKKARRVPL